MNLRKVALLANIITSVGAGITLFILWQGWGGGALKTGSLPFSSVDLPYTLARVYHLDYRKEEREHLKSDDVLFSGVRQCLSEQCDFAVYADILTTRFNVVIDSNAEGNFISFKPTLWHGIVGIRKQIQNIICRDGDGGALPGKCILVERWVRAKEVTITVLSAQEQAQWLEKIETFKHQGLSLAKQREEECTKPTKVELY